MINWSNDPAMAAKAQVEKWFGQSQLGPAFIARDGRVFPISADERDRLRRAAESDVLALHTKMVRRAYLVIFLVVGLFMAFSIAAARYQPPVSGIIRTFGYAIYSAHGLWIMLEAWRHHVDVRSVRDRIAAAKVGSVPLPDMMAERLTATNPFQATLVAIVALLFLFYFAAETMAHHGVDLIDAVPPWAYFFVLPLTWGLYFLAQMFDRDRGVGS